MTAIYDKKMKTDCNNVMYGSKWNILGKGLFAIQNKL